MRMALADRRRVLGFAENCRDASKKARRGKYRGCARHCIEFRCDDRQCVVTARVVTVDCRNNGEGQNSKGVRESFVVHARSVRGKSFRTIKEARA